MHLPRVDLYQAPGRRKAPTVPRSFDGLVHRSGHRSQSEQAEENSENHECGLHGIPCYSRIRSSSGPASVADDGGASKKKVRGDVGYTNASKERTAISRITATQLKPVFECREQNLAVRMSRIGHNAEMFPSSSSRSLQRTLPTAALRPCFCSPGRRSHPSHVPKCRTTQPRLPISKTCQSHPVFKKFSIPSRKASPRSEACCHNSTMPGCRRPGVWSKAIGKCWQSPGLSSYATSCSITGISTEASSAFTCAYSMCRCRPVGDPAPTKCPRLLYRRGSQLRTVQRGSERPTNSPRDRLGRSPCARDKVVVGHNYKKFAMPKYGCVPSPPPNATAIRKITSLPR